MSLHIAKFIDRLKNAQDRCQRDVIMPITEAQGLHADITRLLLLSEKATVPAVEPETIKVEIQGGSFRSGS